MPQVIGEYIDRLISTELRPNGTLPRGVAHQLYQAARARSGVPMSFGMASGLIREVNAHDRVVIVTGAGGPPNMPSGEVDGLLGTMSVARALAVGVKAEVHVLVEERFLGPATMIARAAELNVRSPDGPPWADSVAIHESPVGISAGDEFSVQILDRLRPSALLAVEKLSVNDKGVIHGVTGLPWSDVHFDAKCLFDTARERGILTCGIGDGGNEIGWGGIDEVKSIMPEGALCRCPCEGGIAAAVETDLFLHGAISDWGAYGLTGMLALLLRRPDLVASPDYVENMLRAAMAAGVVCGWYSRPMLSDDGVPLDAQRALATLVQTAVSQGLLEYLESSSH